MQDHILHDVRVSIPLMEKSSGHFEDLHKLKLLTNVDVDLASLSKEVMNLRYYYSNATTPRNEARLT